MQTSIAANPMAETGRTVPRDRSSPMRAWLWQRLSDAWLRRLERRIEHDLRWLDHDGVSADFRRASRG